MLTKSDEDVKDVKPNLTAETPDFMIPVLQADIPLAWCKTMHKQLRVELAMCNGNYTVQYMAYKNELIALYAAEISRLENPETEEEADS